MPKTERKVLPIKTSVFLSPELHEAVVTKAKANKVSASAWIAKVLATRLGISLDNGNGATYY